MADAPIVETPAPPAEVAWHSNLPADVAALPGITKFPNTKEGLGQMAKGYAELERVMSNEKIPVPKGPDDKVAHDLFRQAFKIPDKAEAYGLPDVAIPESMKGLGFDKNGFASAVHGQNLTTEQAKGLWDVYSKMQIQTYEKAVETQKAQLIELSNKLRQEWGKEYDGRVKLAQDVINKFTGDQAENDWMTNVLLKDPRGARILSKIGEQFAENRIGDFKYDQTGMTGEEAQKELDKMRGDKTHPLNNEKAPQADRDRAIARQLELINILNRFKSK